MRLTCQVLIVVLLFVDLVAAIVRDAKAANGRKTHEIVANVLGSFTAAAVIAGLLYGAGTFAE